MDHTMSYQESSAEEHIVIPAEAGSLPPGR